ncbi:MAG: lysine exporter LysO family protein [Acinetobacter sp.]|nr:lysine exporter LysO family protein [Acinetobacter sp.]
MMLLGILEGLSIVLVPMLLGYALVIKNARYLNYINHIVMLLLYVILFVMGVALGQLDNLASTLPMIAVSALTFSVCIHACNIAGLMAYDRYAPVVSQATQQDLPPRWRLLLDSCKLCSMVLLGGVVGYYSKGTLNIPFGTSTYVLIALIFFVGIQLRNNGIALKDVIFNRRGLITGAIFIVTSLLGGGIAAWCLDLPITQALAIASGFGWYSLSSVIIHDAWGAVFGSIAFFNDLSREILSLFIIPFFMQRYRSTAVGVAGATALDCTLPIIQRAGGIDVVPLAISFGFVTNIVPPILMVFFASIPL